MNKSFMLFGTLLLFCATTQGQQLFPSCDEVLEDESYKRLKDYLEKAQQANYCQQLNSHEFLYTTDQQIYYCDFRVSGTSACAEDSMGARYPELDVAARFNGPNGKRFVLLMTQNMAGGIFNSGYQLAYLVPKHISPRGYTVLNLNGIGEHNGESSDAGKACSNLDEDTEAIEGTKYQIINEGKRDVAVVFTQSVISCKTGRTSAERIEYRWRKSKFVRIKDSQMR